MHDDEIDDEILETLGMCGCGIPEDVLSWIHKLLRLIDAKYKAGALHFEQREPFDSACVAVEAHFYEICKGHIAEYAIWYWLDSRGLLEHGGSIGGSWLTEKGEELLAELDARNKSD